MSEYLHISQEEPLPGIERCCDQIKSESLIPYKGSNLLILNCRNRSQTCKFVIVAGKILAHRTRRNIHNTYVSDVEHIVEQEEQEKIKTILSNNGLKPAYVGFLSE